MTGPIDERPLPKAIAGTQMHADVAKTLTAADVSAHAGDIRRWLLSELPQIRGGEHDGGVLGWVSSSDAFVYPEVMGYYLTVLKFISCEAPALSAECAARAARALGWLDRRETWKTRDYLRSRGRDDWRNHAMFTFDLGTVLRGAVHWTSNRQLHRLAATVRGRCLAELEKVPPSTDCLLGSHRRTAQDGRRIPARWSTLPGPHHVKVAAIVGLLPAAARPPSVDGCARRTIQHWRKWAQTGTLIPEVHPLLYFLEGLVSDALACDEKPDWDLISRVLHTVLLARSGEGDLSERLEHPVGRRRGDVTAQALRLCSLAVLGLNEKTATPRTVGLRAGGEHVCGALVRRYIGGAGEVHSFPTRGTGSRNGRNPANVWAAIFAYQALRFYSYLLRGEPVPLPLVRLLA
jgi:hypothetical protein